MAFGNESDHNASAGYRHKSRPNASQVSRPCAGRWQLPPRPASLRIAVWEPGTKSTEPRVICPSPSVEEEFE
jgi:hypothetical protein